MKKRKSTRIISVLLSLVMAFTLCSGLMCTSASAVISGNWTYTVEGKNAVITNYLGIETALTVPSKIDGYFVKSVTGLCNAIQKNKVKSITFSEGINEISPSICNGYSILEQVSLPASLTTIGNSAFANCPKLKGITIPSSVTQIGNYAFQGCTSLSSAVLNCKITSIPEGCFSSCSSLGNISLPTTLTSIGNNAFSNCSALAVINFPHSITSIGDSAFLNCAKLSGRIVIPENTKSIGEFAFSGCKAVTEIFIPNKTKTIGTEAFSNCDSLSIVYVGNSVTKIENNAFSSCKAFDKIVFSGSYFNLSKVFDLQYIPTVYYPSNLSSSWSKYLDGAKKAYSPATSVSISGSKELTVNESTTLKTTISPNLSSLGKVYYLKSSNPAVASVTQDGVVTAKAGGTTKITATTINGKTKSITIKVVPKKVTDVSAEPLTTSSVQVTWRANDTVAGYIVYRSTSKSSGYTEVGTTTTNSFTDKGLTKGKTYYYKVRAFVKDGKTTLKSESSAYDSVKVTSPAPSSVSAKKSKSKVAKISWTKAIGAEGYEIAMATSKNGTYKSIKTVTSGSTLSFTKSGLTKGKTYYFKVRSYITVNGNKVYSPFTKIVSCKV